MSDDYIFEMSAGNSNQKKPDFKNLKDPYGANEAKVKASLFSKSLEEIGFDRKTIAYALFCSAAQAASDNDSMEDFLVMVHNYVTSEGEIKYCKEIISSVD